MYWLSNVDLSSLKIENWDGEYTVFQPESGKTHFLNEMGLKILLILDQSPATLGTLCQELSEYFTLLPDAKFSGQIMKTLQRYEALGLVSSVTENT
ncbi:HPr-rel-A system PqqD family peptide chaperone [Nitrosomonas sp. HPC101]|uniref:HPr-rel-A system PqqD family peptide chaperone n=1 Tax=Nitrosomonas sp. HPC101 TaxID=1658667 RepID=UPI00136AB109|nr:HPr-rel-A system PqqD family peptide chaperone [Nitrosomonas sp. HPC101]MXS84752.1 HPr-rel-A system PqqD family peptide chaperone [Nitrosomonas sp. HPC101]